MILEDRMIERWVNEEIDLKNANFYMNLVVKLGEIFWLNQLRLRKIPVAEPNYFSINMVKIPSISRKFSPAPCSLAPTLP